MQYEQLAVCGCVRRLDEFTRRNRSPAFVQERSYRQFIQGLARVTTGIPRVNRNETIQCREIVFRHTFTEKLRPGSQFRGAPRGPQRGSAQSQAAWCPGETGIRQRCYDRGVADVQDG
jgi:hypothetical protein